MEILSTGEVARSLPGRTVYLIYHQWAAPFIDCTSDLTRNKSINQLTRYIILWYIIQYSILYRFELGPADHNIYEHESCMKGPTISENTI